MNYSIYEYKESIYNINSKNIKILIKLKYLTTISSYNSDIKISK